MIRQMPVVFAREMFGPRLTAAELIRRRKEWCDETGSKYVRKTAIEEAAHAVNMDFDQLNNWLSRSKRARAVQ